MADHPYIDLVIPVLNPSKDWAEETVRRHGAFEALIDGNVRLTIVDDGSASTSAFDALKKSLPNCQVLHLTSNRGKGYALRHGISNAQSNCILFTDADFPYELEGMADIVLAIRGGKDVALGHRQTDYYRSVPWFRKGLSEFFRFVLKRILRFPITDTQCGLKGMNQKGKEIFLKTRIDRFLIDMEFIKLAVRSNLEVQPVVVKLRPDVQFSKMGLGVLLPELLNFFRIIFI